MNISELVNYSPDKDLCPICKGCPTLVYNIETLSFVLFFFNLVALFLIILKREEIENMLQEKKKEDGIFLLLLIMAMLALNCSLFLAMGLYSIRGA